MPKHITNVLHLIDQYRIGGPGKTVINSSRFIDVNTYQLYAASFLPRDMESEFSNAAKQADLPYLGLNDTKGFNAAHIRQLKKFTQAEGIGILHSHGYKSNMYAVVIKWLIPEIKIVSTYHGWIQNNFRQKIYYLLDLFLSRYFDANIVVSQSIYDSLPASRKSDASIYLIHNAIVSSDYQIQGHRENIRSSLAVNPDEILIGVVGRLSAEKGCRDMLHVFRALNHKKVTPKLVFIGEGPLKSPLIMETKRLQLNGKVLFAGYQNPIQPFYEALDILVCPSHTEGLSNVILEAFTYSKPVVATNVGGNGEIISDGISGFLVPPSNYRVMKEKLSTLIISPNLRSDMGVKGKHTIKNHFSFEARMRKIEKVYSRLI